MFVINSLFSPLYTFFIAFSEFFFESSIDIILMFDCTIVPDVSTCAIARYLLSSDIDVATTRVVDNIVLNNEFPWLSNSCTTVL